MFGSERYIKFKPEWVIQAENQLFGLPLWPGRKFPTTVIKFNGGRGQYRVDGYWAEQIKLLRRKPLNRASLEQRQQQTSK